MRVRWGNVGRAAVVAGVLALAVAWPRLAPEPPRLPSDEGIPLASPTPAAERAEAERRPERKLQRPKRGGRRKAARRAPKERPSKRRAVRRPPAPQPTPEAPAKPAPPPRPRPSAPTFTPQDPATTEFSFESG